jgi:hypothetical protein
MVRSVGQSDMNVVLWMLNSHNREEKFHFKTLEAYLTK